MQNYLSIVAIIKDEDRYIDEFIHYYRLLGVDHFYFYDNDSTIPLTQSLSKYQQFTTINTIHGKSRQMDAYKDYLSRYGKDSRWAAFIDIDEFIVPKPSYMLSEFLRKYEASDGLGINWVLFGDNGHQKDPGGLVIEQYTKREGTQNPHIKSILNPQKVVEPINPHFMRLVDGCHYTDAFHYPITNAFNTHPSLDLIQINHYYSKSIEESLKKAERGRADNGEKRDVALEFDRFRHLWNQQAETYIKDKYLNALKNSISID